MLYVSTGESETDQLKSKVQSTNWFYVVLQGGKHNDKIHNDKIHNDKIHNDKTTKAKSLFLQIDC